MFKFYCDYDHNTIVNYVSNNHTNLYGMDKINKIFWDVKDSIQYSGSASRQKASETLVMGIGNNADKCILLYTLLKNSGFNCSIFKVDIIDNSNIFVSRNNKPIPWFYVEIDFFKMKIIFDPSFDKSFMRAAGITHRSPEKGYGINDYVIKGQQHLFKIVGEPEKVTDDKVMDELFDKLCLKLA